MAKRRRYACPCRCPRAWGLLGAGASFFWTRGGGLVRASHDVKKNLWLCFKNLLRSFIQCLFLFQLYTPRLFSHSFARWIGIRLFDRIKRQVFQKIYSIHCFPGIRGRTICGDQSPRPRHPSMERRANTTKPIPNRSELSANYPRSPRGPSTKQRCFNLALGPRHPFPRPRQAFPSE